jgi:hypothetical protein
MSFLPSIGFDSIDFSIFIYFYIFIVVVTFVSSLALEVYKIRFWSLFLQDESLADTGTILIRSLFSHFTGNLPEIVTSLLHFFLAYWTA